MMHLTNKYMDYKHPDAFVDWERRKSEYMMTKECPRCKGFGGWNLQLNAYSLPEGFADTAENRHKFVHFRAMCGHCHGWGYTVPEESCTGHDWTFTENLGNCYNRYACIHCGKHADIDSSD